MINGDRKHLCSHTLWNVLQLQEEVFFRQIPSKQTLGAPYQKKLLEEGNLEHIFLWTWGKNKTNKLHREHLLLQVNYIKLFIKRNIRIYLNLDYIIHIRKYNSSYSSFYYSNQYTIRWSKLRPCSAKTTFTHNRENPKWGSISRRNTKQHQLRQYCLAKY